VRSPQRQLARAAALLVLCLPAVGHAFTDSRISEVMAGVGTGGSATVQYIEIVMRSPGQNDVMGTIVGFFRCDGATFIGSPAVPTNVSNGAAGAHWIMATTGFQAAAGIAPDDDMLPGYMTPIGPNQDMGRYPCGMICWGKPTTPSKASDYVDCVAYHGYHGSGNAAIPPFAGTATTLAPGDGTLSLTRISDTGNNAADFALMPPTPTNNAGQMGSLGGAGTTTTTTPGGGTSTSTTTTTFPPGFGERIAGTRLLLTTAKNPKKSSFALLAKDSSITIADPRQSGGTLRVFAAAGDGFDHTYALPAGSWKAIGKPSAVKGYRFKNAAGPIRLVLIKQGKIVKAVGKGAGLVQTLAADPRPVSVALGAGSERYCMSFGGSITFKAGKKFLATGAPAGAPCP